MLRIGLDKADTRMRDGVWQRRFASVVAARFYTGFSCRGHLGARIEREARLVFQKKSPVAGGSGRLSRIPARVFACRHSASATARSTSSMSAVGSNRAIRLPSLPTINFVKFHMQYALSPNRLLF